MILCYKNEIKSRTVRFLLDVDKTSKNKVNASKVRDSCWNNLRSVIQVALRSAERKSRVPQPSINHRFSRYKSVKLVVTHCRNDRARSNLKIAPVGVVLAARAAYTRAVNAKKQSVTALVKLLQIGVHVVLISWAIGIPRKATSPPIKRLAAPGLLRALLFCSLDSRTCAAGIRPRAIDSLLYFFKLDIMDR